MQGAAQWHEPERVSTLDLGSLTYRGFSSTNELLGDYVVPSLQVIAFVNNRLIVFAVNKCEASMHVN
jgi:hypothetical protein